MYVLALNISTAFRCRLNTNKYLDKIVVRTNSYQWMRKILDFYSSSIAFLSGVADFIS